MTRYGNPVSGPASPGPSSGLGITRPTIVRVQGMEARGGIQVIEARVPAEKPIAASSKPLAAPPKPANGNVRLKLGGLETGETVEFKPAPASGRDEELHRSYMRGYAAGVIAGAKLGQKPKRGAKP